MKSNRPINTDDATSVQLLGECIMPRLQIEQFANDEAYAALIMQLVHDHKAGGFCVFGGTPETVVMAIHKLQEEAAHSNGVPLIFSADCEFGLPMRLTNGGTEFPDAMAIAHTGDPELARAAGQAIAKEMKALGIAWNFAPVADVNSNPKNPIINTRSFGEDPAIVSSFVVPFMAGLEAEGVAATAKHFPGHGDTSVDSHLELPFVEGGWERFDKIELSPFQALAGAGIQSVMPGHLAAPQLSEYLGASREDQMLPATLSPVIISKLLRERMGFQGVVVTDALEMRAITNLFGEGEAVVRAFEAGADVLLMPANPELAFEALSTALASGRITFDELREKAARIGALKKFTRVENDQIGAKHLRILEKEHAALAREIAEQALDCNGEISLHDATLAILADDRPEAITKAEKFLDNISTLFTAAKLVKVSDWDETNIELNSDSILATFHRARGYLGGSATNASVPRIMARIAEDLAGRGVKLRGLILFGSPYLGEEFEVEPGFVLKTFSESLASIEAVTKKLLAIP